jgi:hypothetical protein
LFGFYYKKNNQTEFFFLKNKTKSKLVQTNQFGFLGQKPVQTGFWLSFFSLTRFFRFWLGFFGLARFFSRFFFWLGFGSVFSVSGL